MVNRPSVPEIITVNSETLQTLIRDLLPSQNGFGSELQATNVITPIIDLTATAEGSSLDTSLAQAIAFGSNTAFDVTNAGTDLITTPGWYRITGTATVNVQTGGSDRQAGFKMTDGSSTKTVYQVHFKQGSAANGVAVSFDLIFAVATGITLSAFTTADDVTIISGSHRQVADSAGNTVQPVGLPL